MTKHMHADTNRWVQYFHMRGRHVHDVRERYKQRVYLCKLKQAAPLAIQMCGLDSLVPMKQIALSSAEM